MPKSLVKLGAAAFALSLALPASAQDALTADSVVATVNGTEIKLGHMLLARSTLPEQYQQLPPDVLWDGLLEQMIRQEALAQDDLAVETGRMKLALENERRSLLAAETMASVMQDAVTEDAVQAAYEDQYLNAAQGVEYNASHILVQTEEEAQALVAELEDGADFATLAQERSTGPSGPNGGALGWFGPGMMVAPFQEAVEALEPGTVSAPVQTQFGWHVIRLNETRTQEAPPLDSVRGELQTALQRAAVEAHIETLVAGADVTRIDATGIDKSVIGNLDLLEP